MYHPTAAPTEPPTEAPTQAPTEALFDPAVYSNLGYALCDELNVRRQSAGLGQLSLSEDLCSIARVRAGEASYFWSHTRPDGRDFTSALEDQSYGFTSAAESLIYVSSDSSTATMADNLMNSNANRANILSSSFTTVGIGTYLVDSRLYIACIFTD